MEEKERASRVIETPEGMSTMTRVVVVLYISMVVE